MPSFFLHPVGFSRRGRMAAAAVALGAAALAGACDSGPRRPRLPGPSPGEPTSGRGGGGALPAGVGPGPVGAGSGSGGGSEAIISDPDGPCDAGLDVDDPAARNAARALGLCKDKDPDDDGDWGVISTRWSMVDGAPLPSGIEDAYAIGHGILDVSFGRNSLRPLEGDRFLLLSTGAAREPNRPGYAAERDKGYLGSPPDGFPREATQCGGIVTGPPHDDIALEVTMKAPPGAEGLAFDFIFYTREWPVYVCTTFNDFFVALLSPRRAGQATDNISFDGLGNPISVNAAFLDVCDCPGTGDCTVPPATPQFDYACNEGDLALQDTGFDSDPQFPQWSHGATQWLTTVAPVAPEETVTLRFAAWDSADGIFDSSTLIDDFRWRGRVEGPPVTEPR
ncbi:MAG: choice-of-anchor L domain-containing protein [Myxococcota bacterium]